MNNLEQLRTEAGWNMREAAKNLGLKYTTYVSYEKGDRPLYSEMLIKIADLYGVSVDYILGRDQTVVQLKPRIVQQYEKLDDTSRAVVDAVMNIELSRDAQEDKPTKVVPLFPAAAGCGEMTDGGVIDEWQVDADSKAVVAVRISGDSMEPEFHSGDVVLVESRDPRTGDIAVVMVNGFLLVKQFIAGYNGQVYLRSLNRKRADLDYTYLPSSSDTCVVWGTVIHKKIPLAD